MNLKKLITSQSRFAEIIRFAFVGGFSTVLQYGLYIVFLHAVKLTPVISSMVSYAISFIANYFLSNYFTFKSSPNFRSGLGFAASHLFNMGLQTGLVAIFKGIVGPTLALLPAMAICFPCNYLLVRFALTSDLFNRKSKKDKQNPKQETLLEKEDNLIDEL